MGSKVKQQHYVPQFYLRNFVDIMGKGNLVHVFDKIDNRSFGTGTRNIGAEQFFYESYKDGQKMEKDLSHFEGEYHKICIKLLDKKDISTLNNEEKHILASFVVMQEIRTRETRDFIGRLRRDLKEKLLGRGVTSDFEKEVKVIDDEEAIKEQQLSMMRDISEFVEIVKGMKWVLFINNTKWGFWTSDHPIVRINRQEFEFPYGNMGYKSKGIELHFPLSPQLLLTILDPDHYKLFGDKYEVPNEEYVKYENHIQIRNATRFIYSNNSDFSFAEEVVKTDPDANNPSRISIYGLDVEEK